MMRAVKDFSLLKYSTCGLSSSGLCFFSTMSSSTTFSSSRILRISFRLGLLRLPIAFLLWAFFFFHRKKFFIFLRFSTLRTYNEFDVSLAVCDKKLILFFFQEGKTCRHYKYFLRCAFRENVKAVIFVISTYMQREIEENLRFFGWNELWKGCWGSTFKGCYDCEVTRDQIDSNL